MGLRDRSKKLFGTATKGVLGALNRADEIGGEVRDFIQDKVLTDDRYVAMRKRVNEMRGKSYTSKTEQEEEAADVARAVAEAAPPPAAEVVEEEVGLGDPGLPAQVYGKESCPWSGRARTLLDKLNVDYDFIDLDEDENMYLSDKLIPETRQNTVPFVYVRGEFVGGFNALSELARLGQLEYALMSPEEKANANPALKKVVITARPNSDETAPGEA
jgi:glutaredoxin